MAYWEPASLMTLAVSFMNLTTILLLLRYVTLRITNKRPGLADIALTIAWVLNTAIDINMITGVAYGLLGNELPLPVDDPEDMAFGYNDPLEAQLVKFYYVQDIILPLQLTFAKLSIVLFYRRVLVPERRGFTHWATAITIALVSQWGIAFFFINIFQCGTQFALIGDGPLMTSLTACLPIQRDLAFCITDLTLDLIIFLLPLRLIFNLKMTLTKKLQVAGAFMLGGLSVAGATVRLAAIMSQFVTSEGGFVENVFTTSSPSVLNSIIMYWGTFEAGFAVTTASLPGLRPLFNRVVGTFGNTWSTMRATRGGDSAGTELRDDSRILVEKRIEVSVSTTEA